MEANIARLRITGCGKHYYKMALLRFFAVFNKPMYTSKIILQM